MNMRVARAVETVEGLDKVYKLNLALRSLAAHE
jgi:hypothetical protein